MVIVTDNHFYFIFVQTDSNMKWNLKETKTVNGKEVRVYESSTGSTCETMEIYIDSGGNKWFGFRDLFKIPYIRVAYAKHISDLFSIGLGLSDIVAWCKAEKDLIRSDDPEKYEKLFALILEKERIAKSTADPVRQHLALCTVYVLSDDERIDLFKDEDAETKLKLWGGDRGAITFFLNWHNAHIQRYTKALDRISKTVLKVDKFNQRTQAQ